VASIARDDPFPPPGMHHDHNAPACTATRICAVNLDRNLKPKLAIMRQCTSVTDRRKRTSYHKHEMYILHLALKTVRLQDVAL